MLNVTVKVENYPSFLSVSFTLSFLPRISLLSPSLSSLITTLSVPHSLTISSAPPPHSSPPLHLFGILEESKFSFRNWICFSCKISKFRVILLPVL